ncbi:MAG: hypothetical protein LBV08_04445 [Clostridiales bacterium]|jgi:hypothetical protein|nr:hypothetical protein [Clostridiales bacterium]
MINRVFYLDLQEPTKTRGNVAINQNNQNSVVFEFHITDGATEVDYSKFTSAEITLAYQNSTLCNDVCEIKGDKVIYNLRHEALQRPGLIMGPWLLKAAIYQPCILITM